MVWVTGDMGVWGVTLSDNSCQKVHGEAFVKEESR